MMNQLCLSPLLFLAVLLAAVFIGSPVGCMAVNHLRTSSTSSEDAIVVSDSDLVGTSSYLVVQVEGYGMNDLSRISPQKQAILDCVFHKAFDEVHGNRDGLYLSGQQILATTEEATDVPNDRVDDIDTIENVELKKKYVYRPRNFSKKQRPHPSYPPPKPPPQQYPIKDKWNIYWHIDSSGRCNMCPDDDSMETTSLLLNTYYYQNENENLALAYKKAHDEGIASDFVMSEASVNAIADAMRTKFIEGSCAVKGDNDHSFEYVQDTDIFVLSQTDFEESVAAITASRETKNGAQAVSVAVADLEASHSVTELLPFYFGASFHTTGIGATSTINPLIKMIKIGLSGVDCGPWNNEALLDLNSGLHDSINSLGFTDKGHVVDKIVGGRKQPRSERRYVWKCHYDVYAKLDLEGDVLDEPSLDNIGDALCDDMVQNGGSEKFKNVIDCQLQLLSAAEYEANVAVNKKAGLPVSSARK